VNIIIYGRDAKRFDQIYGSDFVYDQRPEMSLPPARSIWIWSPIHRGPPSDSPQPQEIRNPVHLKTSGLTFNHKTGYAHTSERIEFRIPEAVGSAVGATTIPNRMFWC